MGRLFIILAQADPLAPHRSKQYGLTLRDMLLIVGTALVVGLVLFLIVYFSRRKRSERPHRHHRHSHDHSQGDTSAGANAEAAPPASAPAVPAGAAPGEERHHHRRRGRRRHRRSRGHHWEPRLRNPTLQETGGLPPIRPDDEAPRI